MMRSERALFGALQNSTRWNPDSRLLSDKKMSQIGSAVFGPKNDILGT